MIRWKTIYPFLFVVFCSSPLWAAEPDVAQKSVWDVIQTGGFIGYVIILLSVVGFACVAEAFFRLREETLVPPMLSERVLELAERGRFEEVLSLCKTHSSMLGRIITNGLTDGKLGIDAVREGLQQQGVIEVTQLRQRNGYLGLIASVTPMLGLLGTVLGMIASFGLLGQAQGAARPDELAVGISQALVTTCMGLIAAVPLTFFHAYFRNRITRIGHDAVVVSERMLRLMAVVIEVRRQGVKN